MKKSLILLLSAMSLCVSISASALTWTGTITDEKIEVGSGYHVSSRFRLVDSQGVEIVRVSFHNPTQEDMKVLIERLRRAAADGKTVQIVHWGSAETDIYSGATVILYVWE